MEISVAKIRTKLIQQREKVNNIYLIIWCIYYVYMFLGTTMLNDKWLVLPYRICVVFTMLIVVYRVISIDNLKTSIFDLLLIVSIIFITGKYYMVHHLKLWFIWGLMIIAARDVKFDQIVKVSVISGIIIMILAFIFSQLGLVEDLIYNTRGKAAHAFGICYTTDCAAHVLFIVMGICYLKNGNLKILDYIILCLITLLLYITTRARNNSICIGILLFASIIYSFLLKKNKITAFSRRVISIIFILFPFIFALATIYITINFSTDIHWMVKLDSVLGGRYRMGNEAFENYGISLWGEMIPQVGRARTTIFPSNYFCLDISYILVFLEKGIAIFSLMIIMLLKTLIKIRKNLYLMGIIVLIALQCTVEHHWMELAYNYFLLIAFAKMNSERDAIYREETIY